MAKGVDFAWGKPTVSQMHAVGATWGAGYFSNDSTKNWTKSLVAEFLAAGFGVVSVWETTTTRATDGYQAGVDDAHSAESERASVGLDNKTIIHFAVDEDTDWASVASYFAGAASVIGKDRVGVYGGIRIINGAAAAGYRFLWQALAWSAGQWSPHATIRQEGGTVFGGSADVDYSETTDFGQTPRPNAPQGDWFTVSPIPTSDLNAIADAVAGKLIDGPHRDTLAAATLYWLQRALDPSIPLDPKNTAWPVQQAIALRTLLATRDKAEVTAESGIKTELDVIKTAVAAATDALAKLAADQNVTAAAVQQGVQDELVKLGQALGNLK